MHLRKEGRSLFAICHESCPVGCLTHCVPPQISNKRARFSKTLFPKFVAPSYSPAFAFRCHKGWAGINVKTLRNLITLRSEVGCQKLSFRGSLDITGSDA
ncbi:hypothetical protein CDAR_527381 [Caerostris darwini]|uniref:Uncharacterized protein n=1 Tax=Caerostris darwini TaxID=1538125 RepID=A0AAV4WMF6_9ARAC|nr:hypothetical protein CDAR_527381 [Caerostris darwini]